MAEQLPVSFNRHNVIFLLLCLMGLGCIYFIGVFPLHSEANRLQDKLQKLEIASQEQAQIHSMLTLVGNTDITHEKSILPKVLLTSLQQSQTDLILPDFEKIAAKSAMKVIDISPQLKKTADLNRLLISARVQGDFQYIRMFLYDLLNLTYVSQIHTIELKAAGEQLECYLTYSVNLT
nr:hypothetical protein [Desulfobulbaceae bacterium]